MERPAIDTCWRTGLAVPECCCPACVEAMLRRFQPALLPDEIRITRTETRSEDLQERPRARRSVPPGQAALDSRAPAD
ncbi:MAG TPA: hypothetical protein VHJ54_07820 [Solirubrobacterales bacterium]|nr:hypothetical protein [Solirubrobacterales bacterium]